jgi:hypothetical protein
MTCSLRYLIQLLGEKINQIAKWLSPLHYNTKHEMSVEKHDDTGTWLFKQDIYQEWESSSPSKLWIHGIPGCGKTILAYISPPHTLVHCRWYRSRSTVIERLRQASESLRDNRLAFAYFYCQFNNEETNPLNIIRTLLAQLLHSLDYAAIETLEDLFYQFSEGHSPPADVKRLTDLMVRVGKLYPRSIIVIDGLDECALELRRNLLDFIITLASSDNFSILVFSRKEVDIVDRLDGFPTISLEQEQINLKEDMRKIINKEFEDSRKWGHRFQTMKEEISESLILGSGMNMWGTME